MNTIDKLQWDWKDIIIYKMIKDIINFSCESILEKECLFDTLNRLYKLEIVNHSDLDSLIIFVRSRYSKLIDNESIVDDYKPYLDSLLSKASIADYLCDLHSKATFFVTKLWILNNLFPHWKPWSLNKIVNDYFVVSIDQKYYLVKERIIENSTLIVKSTKYEESIMWFDGNYLFTPSPKSRLEYIWDWYYLCDNQSYLDIIDETWFVFFSFDNSFIFCWSLKDKFWNIFRLIWKKSNNELFTKELYYNIVHDLWVINFSWNYDEVDWIEYYNWITCVKWVKDWIESYFDISWNIID